jgi:hypothetical protein
VSNILSTPVHPYPQSKQLTIPDPITPESILARAAVADLTLELARWTLRRWDQLQALQRSALNYGLNYGGHVGNGQVVFSVQLSSLLEALDVLRRQPELEE